MRIIRGTTPTLGFVLPFDTNILVNAYVTISQRTPVRTVLIDKAMADCRFEGTKLSVTLTQEETLSLDSTSIAEIQIRAKTAGGEVIASDIIQVPTGRILKDGLL